MHYFDAPSELTVDERRQISEILLNSIAASDQQIWKAKSRGEIYRLSDELGVKNVAYRVALSLSSGKNSISDNAYFGALWELENDPLHILSRKILDKRMAA